MATEVVVTVRSSGGDYTSLSSAEAGEQRNLVGVDEIAVIECYNDWPSGLNDSVDIAGWTTDSTRYVKITAAIGHRHGGIPGAGFWIRKANVFGVVKVSTAYCVVEHIEVVSTGTSHYAVVSGTGTIAGIRFQYVIASSQYLAFSLSGTSASVTLIGCLGTGCSSRAFGCADYNSHIILNCVAANNAGTGFLLGLGSSKLVKNCVAYNNGTNWSGSASASSTNNATSSASDDAPGGNSVINVASGDFVNAAGNDFHLSSSSVLRGAGTNLYSDFTTDIDGDTWPSSGAWDIGFDYYVASSSLPTLTGITLSNITTSGYRATVAGS